MDEKYLPMVLCGLAGFTIGGMIGVKALIPSDSGLRDEFITIFVMSSVGLCIGALTGYTFALRYSGDA